MHTVIFESIGGGEYEIDQLDELLLAVSGLRVIAGVQSVRVACQSLDNYTAIEEVLLDGTNTLQGFRSDPVHSKVLDLAVPNTNWKVVDRTAPPNYAFEPVAIQISKATGKIPVMRHKIYAFAEGTSQCDIDAVSTDLGDAVHNADGQLIFPGEVAASLDRRKGNLTIVRMGWHNINDASKFEQSSEYSKENQDLRDIVTSVTVATHYL